MESKVIGFLGVNDAIFYPTHPCSVDMSVCRAHDLEVPGLKDSFLLENNKSHTFRGFQEKEIYQLGIDCHLTYRQSCQDLIITTT